jgi:hypothetical protein
MKMVKAIMLSLMLLGVTSAFADTKVLKCVPTAASCVVPVAVVVMNSNCTASISNGEVQVAKGVRTLHVWKLPKSGKHEWDLSKGIEIVADKDLQVIDKGIDKNGNFWILNANTVPGSVIDYMPNVRLVSGTGKNQACVAVDPRIVNSL